MSGGACVVDASGEGLTFDVSLFLYAIVIMALFACESVRAY